MGWEHWIKEDFGGKEAGESKEVGDILSEF